METQDVDAGAWQVNGHLPLYRDPRPVHAATHGQVALKAGAADFSFIAQSPMIRLTVDEMERAALDYPIALFGADRQPYAIMSLDPQGNAFVVDGAFRPGAYIPAFVRRYPFVLARDEASDTLVLCLDHGSDMLVTADGDATTQGALPLFADAEPAQLTNNALQFCEAYEAAVRRTQGFAALLDQYGLLVEREVRSTAGGSNNLLLAFAAIDRDKLDALPADDFQALRAAGALPAIYALIASQANWDVLAGPAPAAAD